MYLTGKKEMKMKNMDKIDYSKSILKQYNEKYIKKSKVKPNEHLNYVNTSNKSFVLVYFDFHPIFIDKFINHYQITNFNFFYLLLKIYIQFM